MFVCSPFRLSFGQPQRMSITLDLLLRRFMFSINHHVFCIDHRFLDGGLDSTRRVTAP